MISPRDEVYKELQTFLKETTGSSNVYNTMYMATKPSGDRIEYMLDNFISTSQIYQTRDTSYNSLNVGSNREYRCQLKIKVAYENGLVASDQINKISGALHTHEYVEQYINNLYIETSSMRIRTVPFLNNGLISFIPEIIVDCYLVDEFNVGIDYFTNVEDTEIKIQYGGKNE